MVGCRHLESPATTEGASCSGSGSWPAFLTATTSESEFSLIRPLAIKASQDKRIGSQVNLDLAKTILSTCNHRSYRSDTSLPRRDGRPQVQDRYRRRHKQAKAATIGGDGNSLSKHRRLGICNRELQAVSAVLRLPASTSSPASFTEDSNARVVVVPIAIIRPAWEWAALIGCRGVAADLQTFRRLPDVPQHFQPAPVRRYRSQRAALTRLF